MESNNTDVKIFYLLFDLLLLNLSVAIVYSFSAVNSSMIIPEIKSSLLHANVSELIAYFLYSKRNYYFTDKYIDRVKVFSNRFIILFITLLLLENQFLPEGYYKGMIVNYVAVFYLIKVFVFFYIYKYYQYNRKRGTHCTNAAILGGGKCSLVLGKVLENNPALGFRLAGFISDSDDYSPHRTLGKMHDLASLSERYQIQMLFVTDPKYFTRVNSDQLIRLCNQTGIRVRYIIMNGYWNHHFRYKVKLGRFFEMFNPQEIPLDNITLRLQKRLFDFFFSAIVILLLISWMYPLIGLLIKLGSKGPVLFVQQRTGINNKTFSCLKFRTMTLNDECDTKQAEINDSRVTRIGNFLRRTNLDELPQFINVFLGNMSVVGPRPHMLKHTEQYSALIQSYKVRHFVKPGITGWAQVNGLRGITDELWKMEKRVAYDMEYLEKWNFLWDMKIIVMTLLGRNAFSNAM